MHSCKIDIENDQNIIIMNDLAIFGDRQTEYLSPLNLQSQLRQERISGPQRCIGLIFARTSLLSSRVRNDSIALSAVHSPHQVLPPFPPTVSLPGQLHPAPRLAAGARDDSAPLRVGNEWVRDGAARGDRLSS